jgi:DivIVA domain-containing protein
LGDIRDELPADIREPSFAASVRGYDRRAVDAYVERVNRLIAELQLSGSPKAAVRHALERVGEQTSAILQRARDTAEEITTAANEEAQELVARAKAEAADLAARAQQEASETIARARAEAGEIVAATNAEVDELRTRASDETESTLARARVESEARIRRAEEMIASLHDQAEARMLSLQANIAATEEERRAQLEEIRRIAARLDEVVAEGEAAEAEVPRQGTEPAEPSTPVAIDEETPGAADARQAQGEQRERTDTTPE